MTFIRIARMSPTFSFRLRTKRNRGDAMIYCRLRYDGLITTEYKIYVTVPVEIWPDLPDSHPQSAGIRTQLSQVKADHLAITLNLENPTAEGIKAAWLEHAARKKENKSRFPALLDVYDAHVAYLLTPPRRNRSGWKLPAEKTIINRRAVAAHLKAFLDSQNLRSLRLDALRVSHGYRFADYLFDQGISNSTVARYMSFLAGSIDHAMRYDDRIEVNPLLSVKIKGDPKKRIDFLTSLDLVKLASLKLTGILDTVRNWSLLMCCTGLDYKDALLVTKNLGNYYRRGTHGDTLVFQRLKYAHAPQWGECVLPLLDEAIELIHQAPSWSRIRLKVINTHLKTIGPLLGLPFRLHSKIFRKTAGVLLLIHYGDMLLVQKAFGHQSIKTIQQYYINIPSQIVHDIMKKKKQETLDK